MSGKIITTGIDLVDVDYIKKEVSRGKSFLKRVYTPKEIEYCEKQVYPMQHFASRFAGKEAVMKALETGWNYGVCWNQIEILNSKSGSPSLKLSGKAKTFFEQKGYNNVSISMTHYGNLAMAFVVFQGNT